MPVQNGNPVAYFHMICSTDTCLLSPCAICLKWHVKTKQAVCNAEPTLKTGQFRNNEERAYLQEAKLCLVQL